MHSHAPERHSWIRLLSHESLGTSLQQRDDVVVVCSRRSARDDSGMCILIACCVLFTQLASTQALRPHTIDAIGARHAIENWGIELSLGNATRYGLKRIAQGHQQYCLQAANGFAKGQLFLDSGASTRLIHDVSMLVNVRRLSEPKMMMGLTGP